MRTWNIILFADCKTWRHASAYTNSWRTKMNGLQNKVHLRGKHFLHKDFAQLSVDIRPTGKLGSLPLCLIRMRVYRSFLDLKFSLSWRTFRLSPLLSSEKEIANAETFAARMWFLRVLANSMRLIVLLCRGTSWYYATKSPFIIPQATFLDGSQFLIFHVDNHFSRHVCFVQ
jgi:hypothetical protein